MGEDGGGSSRRVRFGPFELDLIAGQLQKHGLRVRLQNQPFQILSALIARRGEIVTRQQIREVLWPGDVFLDYEHGLNRSINKLRTALADSADRPRYIETVPGRGYRFIARVEDFSPARETRLAVLPVGNLTGLKENDYLADGITEAIIDGLGRAVTRRLRVIALASVLQYKDKRAPLAKVAAELAADYLVCGRLRTEDGLFRLRLELVDTRENVSRWTESFEFAGGSLGLVRKGICDQIAGSMELDLLPVREQTVRHANAEVERAYLMGRYYWNQRREDAVQLAIEHYGRAIALDPQYAPAYGALGLSYVVLNSWGAMHPQEAMTKARAAAVRALATDPQSAEAHVALAWAEMTLNCNWAGAEMEFQTAISQNPSNPLPYHWYAYFLVPQGRAPEAFEMNRHALDLDPLSVPINCVRGWLLFVSGRYKEAIAQCRRTAELEASHPAPHAYLATALEHCGKFEDAVREFEIAVAHSKSMPIIRMLLAHACAVAGRRKEAHGLVTGLEALVGKTYLCGYHMALAYLGLGNIDGAFHWLNKSYEDRNAWIFYLAVDPRFAPLRGLPEYKSILEQLPIERPSQTSPSFQMRDTSLKGLLDHHDS